MERQGDGSSEADKAAEPGRVQAEEKAKRQDIGMSTYRVARTASYESEGRSVRECANAERAETLKQERRVEFTLTGNLQQVLERD